MDTCPSAHSSRASEWVDSGSGDAPGGSVALASGITQLGETGVTGGNTQLVRSEGDEGDQTRIEGDEEDRRKTLLSGLQRWYLDVSEWSGLSTEQWDGLLGLLPDTESARVQAFLRENDRKLALGSRLLQRAVVSKVFGLPFSDVEIRRTTEKKPFFAGVRKAVEDGSVSPLLRNWNFNVSHHGKYVAIAAEPACLCGVDIVDTNGRANEQGPAEDYLRYFTGQFTSEEWETIKRPNDDRSKLRRFYLHWGLKEAYVKAIGQGLGYDLRRVSFVPGDWLECCSVSRLERRLNHPWTQEDENRGGQEAEELNAGEWSSLDHRRRRQRQRRRRCSCPRSAVDVPVSDRLGDDDDSGTDSDCAGRDGAVGGAGLCNAHPPPPGGESKEEDRGRRRENGEPRVEDRRWNSSALGEGDGFDDDGQGEQCAGAVVGRGDGLCEQEEDRLGCLCTFGAVTVEVDRVPRPDWSFKVFPLPDGYAACVARGPPSACSPSGQEVGLVSDPNAPACERGQSLPQLRFRKVMLGEIVPEDAATRLDLLPRRIVGGA